MKPFLFDVFLSYNRADQERVLDLAERLRAAGLRVWLDNWMILPGDDIIAAAERGLEDSRVLVLFLSPAALASNWVAMERNAAVFRDPTNDERRFVPVLLEDCDPPANLRRFRYIDLREDAEEAFSELVTACRGEAREHPIPEQKPRVSRAAVPATAAREATFFSLLALGCFLAGMAMAWVMVEHAEKLVRLGLDGRLFYLVLLPLGLAAAGVLFGTLRSYSRYRGRSLGSSFELGGPMASFALVVAGGFLLVPVPAPFAVTVFVHGEAGRQDAPLRREGVVVMDLGPDRRREAVGEKGAAYFVGIPSTFRGREVPVWLEAKGFEAVGPTLHRRLDEKGVDLVVRRKPFILNGRVEDAEGRPIPGAELRLRHFHARSGPDGTFRVEVPAGFEEGDLTLTVSAPGFEVWRSSVVPGSNPCVAQLRREEG